MVRPFSQHMESRAWEFAMNYIGRSGRVDLDRLRSLSPQFVAGYEAWRTRSAQT